MKKRTPFKEEKEVIILKGVVNTLKQKIIVTKIRRRGKH